MILQNVIVYSIKKKTQNWSGCKLHYSYGVRYSVFLNRIKTLINR